MNIPGTIGLKAFLFVFALAGGALALAAPASGAAGGAVVQPTHAAQSMPATLRPVFYQSLAKDAGPAYALNAKGCATLPRQTLTACFDAAGAHFNSKDAALLALHLVGVGRGSDLAAVTVMQPTIAGNQVRYAHGNVSEWWRVLPVGFEQGFTLTQRPAGNGELTLVLASRIVAPAQAGAQSKESIPTQGRDTKSDWIPAFAGMTKKGNTLAFGKLRYGQLIVTDANGKVVPATLTNKGDHILIAVNDAHAVYPLTVDPLVWLEQKATASDGAAYDNFGFSVALAGATAVIGAPYATVGGNSNQGVAYVFTETNGVWSQSQRLTASDGVVFDRFGNSVALAGTTAVIGANQATVGGNTQQGAAYVFTETNGVWSESQKLTASDGAADDGFGYSAALAGATAVIGALQATVGGNADQGAAYVFTGTNGVWSQSQKLTAGDGAAGDHFGVSAALAGATAVIGAYNATVGGNAAQGAAYVFTGTNGVWSQSQKLTASDGAADDDFGNSVALADATAVIGAIGATIGGNAVQGAAYVFTETNGVWSQSQKLTASDGAAGNFFGSSVALAGATAVIGAPDFYGGPGAVYVFTGTNGVWSESQKLTASDGAMGNAFGFSVALAGGSAVIGAYNATIGGNAAQGAAYFEGQSDLGLAVSAPETVAQGHNYTSQTIATNNASASSPAVTATVAVPAAASYISASATQGSCSEASGVVTCDFGQINANAGTATANVTLKATGSVGTTIENTASVALATPALTASAPTAIRPCPDGYTQYDGNLLGGTRAIYAAYYAPAGEENAILTAPADFHMFVIVKNAAGRKTYAIRGTEVHRHAPAGTFAWGVHAGSQGGYFTLCIMHP
ncbi:MAG: FG-GAP repeat protein [Gammaproteobacteria bacterium]